jgi:hypothetical protein
MGTLGGFPNPPAKDSVGQSPTSSTRLGLPTPAVLGLRPALRRHGAPSTVGSHSSPADGPRSASSRPLGLIPRPPDAVTYANCCRLASPCNCLAEGVGEGRCLRWQKAGPVPGSCCVRGTGRSCGAVGDGRGRLRRDVSERTGRLRPVASERLRGQSASVARRRKDPVAERAMAAGARERPAGRWPAFAEERARPAQAPQRAPGRCQPPDSAKQTATEAEPRPRVCWA